MEFKHGQTEELMRVNGKKTQWMVMGDTNGLMEEYIQDNI